MPDKWRFRCLFLETNNRRKHRPSRKRPSILQRFGSLIFNLWYNNFLLLIPLSYRFLIDRIVCITCTRPLITGAHAYNCHCQLRAKTSFRGRSFTRFFRENAISKKVPHYGSTAAKITNSKQINRSHNWAKAAMCHYKYVNKGRVLIGLGESSRKGLHTRN